MIENEQGMKYILIEKNFEILFKKNLTTERNQVIFKLRDLKQTKN